MQTQRRHIFKGKYNEKHILWCSGKGDNDLSLFTRRFLKTWFFSRVSWTSSECFNGLDFTEFDEVILFFRIINFVEWETVSWHTALEDILWGLQSSLDSTKGETFGCKTLRGNKPSSSIACAIFFSTRYDELTRNCLAILLSGSLAREVSKCGSIKKLWFVIVDPDDG